MERRKDNLIALLYLSICFITGYVICSYAFPKLKGIGEYSYSKKPIQLNSNFVLLPAYFLIGTVAQTWVTYMFANVFREKAEPLMYANALSMSIFLLFSIFGCFFLHKKRGEQQVEKRQAKITGMEWIFLIAVCALTYSLMWSTFYVNNNSLHVGYSVFSDFSPHLGMIRSFSYGNNFPTAYSHFAGEDIKYHFMFQFLVGNLEYLGMRIDYAFNIPSALGFISAISVLYAFACKLTAKKVVGFLSCLFFVFRSSYSVFTFLSERQAGTGILEALRNNGEFVSYSTHEDWGLWNLNVYCNQRHFAFSIAILLIVLMLFIPHLYEMSERIGKVSVKEFFRASFLTKEGWYVRDVRLAISAGFLLGSIAFWNGASTIAALLVLFAIAMVADRRFEFLIMAVITTSLSMLQSSAFITGAAIAPQLEFGFIAEQKNFFGAVDYLLRLTGILPYLLLVAFLMVSGIRKYIMFAFSFPLLFAFTVSLTIDVTVNHKYIMISLMLLSIFAAIVIEKLFSKRDFWLRATCVLLVVLLTATGYYDYITVLKKNKSTLAFDLQDPLTMWIKENASSQDIFLSHNYSLNNIVLGGAMLFNGWQYYAWSAGYDTNSRDELVKQMYEADSSETLIQLIEENNIRFIIIDNEVRNSDTYIVNEDVIANTYRAVYSYNGNGSDTVIYDTNYYVN